jgi:hypothetical protein
MKRWPSMIRVRPWIDNRFHCAIVMVVSSLRLSIMVSLRLSDLGRDVRVQKSTVTVYARQPP